MGWTHSGRTLHRARAKNKSVVARACVVQSPWVIGRHWARGALHGTAGQEWDRMEEGGNQQTQKRDQGLHTLRIPGITGRHVDVSASIVAGAGSHQLPDHSLSDFCKISKLVWVWAGAIGRWVPCIWEEDGGLNDNASWVASRLTTNDYIYIANK